MAYHSSLHEMINFNFNIADFRNEAKHLGRFSFVRGRLLFNFMRRTRTICFNIFMTRKWWI